MICTYSLNRDGNLKVSDHFKVKEFACHDGSDKILIDDCLVTILETIRQYLGRPVIVISGYRTKEYNDLCGGAEESYHTKGMAADIRCEGVSLTKLALVAMAFGATGCGIYCDEEHNFVHIDTREKLTIFREA